MSSPLTCSQEVQKIVRVIKAVKDERLKGILFQGWNDNQVVAETLGRFGHGEVYVWPEDGILEAVVFATTDAESKTLRIDNFFVRSRRAMRGLIEIFWRDFAGWRITGNHHYRKEYDLTVDGTQAVLRKLYGRPEIH